MEMYEQGRFLASPSPAGAVIDGGWLGYQLPGPGSQPEHQFYINNVLFVCWLLDKRHGPTTHYLQHSQTSLNRLNFYTHG